MALAIGGKTRIKPKVPASSVQSNSAVKAAKPGGKQPAKFHHSYFRFESTKARNIFIIIACFGIIFATMLFLVIRPWSQENFSAWPKDMTTNSTGSDIARPKKVKLIPYGQEKPLPDQAPDGTFIDNKNSPSVTPRDNYYSRTYYDNSRDRPSQSSSFNNFTPNTSAVNNKPPVADGSRDVLPTIPTDNNIIFRWNFRGKEQVARLKLDPKLMQKYNDIPSNFINETEERKYRDYLTKKSDDDAVERLANRLKNIAAAEKLDDNGLAELIASFVQNAITYDSSFSRYLTPYQTLYYQRGACLEKSLLAYDLYEQLGYGAALFIYPSTPNKKDGHAAIGLQANNNSGFNGSGYYFLETTSNRNIGEVPKDRSYGPKPLVMMKRYGKSYTLKTPALASKDHQTKNNRLTKSFAKNRNKGNDKISAR